MDREGLRSVGAGFYVDKNWNIYFHVREFLAAQGLPDTPEVRDEVWAEVRRDFGVVGVRELPDS